MDDDVKSQSQSSVDLYRSTVVEYERLHNISRPLSPINLVVVQPSPHGENTANLNDLSSSINISHTATMIAEGKHPNLPQTLSVCGTQKKFDAKSVTTPFPNRKGKPLTCNALVSLPDTIRLRGKNNAPINDRELMSVSRFHIRPKTSENPHSELVMSSPHYLNQVKFDGSMSEGSDQVPEVTRPPLGYIEPRGEMQRLQSNIFQDRKKMQRYSYGVSPLQRISRIERDLVGVINSRKASQSSSKRLHSKPSSHVDPYFLPTPTTGTNLYDNSYSPSSSCSSNHLTIEVSLSNQPNPSMPTPTANLMSPPKELNHHYQLLPMNSNLTVFSDVQSIGSPVQSLSGLQSHSKALKLNANPDDYSQQKVKQLIAHELNLKSLVSPTSVTSKKLNSVPKTISSSQHTPSVFGQPMHETFPPAPQLNQKLTNKIRKDPQLYLVKGHRPDSPDYQLYRLSTDPDPTLDESVQPIISFDYLKKRILSKKDKVYDCGSSYFQKIATKGECEESERGTEGETERHNNKFGKSPSSSEERDDPVAGITMIHKISSRDRSDKEGEDFELKLSNSTMPSRYGEGKPSLAERPVNQSRTLQGFIRLREEREIEVKTRVPCVSCLTEANLWCAECQLSYCVVCWNSVPHHQFVHPDQVWRNRCPKNSIEKCEHSVTGLQVHITPQGLVSQGLFTKKKVQFPKGKRSKSPVSAHRLSDFPSTDSIMEKGFNHAENWADLEDEKSFTSEGGSHRNSRVTGLQKAEGYDMKINIPLSELEPQLEPLVPIPQSLGDNSDPDPDVSHNPPVHHVSHPDITDDNSCDGQNEKDPPNDPPPVEGQDQIPHIRTMTPTGNRPLSRSDGLCLTAISHHQSPKSSLDQTNQSYLPPRPSLEYSNTEIPERSKSPKHMMWQVPVGSRNNPSGSSLTTVNRFKTDQKLRQMKGITHAFLPDEWKDKGSTQSNLEFSIHKGVSVATIRR